MPKVIKLDDLELACLSDGAAYTSIEKTIGIDRDVAETLVGGTQSGALFIPVNNYLFKRDDKIVLIDAGSGPSLQPSLGRLPENLKLLGLQPDDVTHILLTHLHSDHANGLIDETGEPTFRNAELLLHEIEFDFWMRQVTSGESAKIAQSRERNQRNLRPYLNQIRLVGESHEAFGCTPVLAPGHTPGHTCWRIDAGQTKLLAWGDTVHFAAIQIPRPDVGVTYDMDVELARSSRLKILAMAADEKLTIAGAHTDAPGIGRIAIMDGTYVFVPDP